MKGGFERESDGRKLCSLCFLISRGDHFMSLRTYGCNFTRPSLLLGVSASALILGTPALAQTATQSTTESTTAPSTTTTADAPQTLTAEQEVESGQNAGTDCAANPDSPTCKASIVVTGSRIRRPNLESPLPVTSVGGEEFFQSGVVSVGDVLNDLPSIRNTFTISNSSRFLGTTGLSLLDLRGLGTNRTLVLVNGRRHVPGDGSASVDINTIPADLIDRVDVVTGGNSAVYGSDAIAGVVNFVLKQDYDGIQVRGQGGLSKYHDLGNEYISVLAGTNFSDGRGNIAANVEVARQDPAYFGHRGGWWGVPHSFVREDTDPSGTPNGSDGNPDFVFYDDTRFPAYNNGGGILLCCTAFESGVVLSPYIFDPNGNLVPVTGTIVGRPNFGLNERYLGGNLSTGREGESAVISPTNNRYSINILGHYTVSDAFEPFIEAKYVNQKARGLNAGPFFFGGGNASGSFLREAPHIDNPFLSDQARNLIADYYGVAPDDPNFQFGEYSTVTDLGNRDDKLTRDTYRIVGGVRGQFNGDWNYEVSANYGVNKQRNLVAGNVNVQRFLLSLDAVRDPATGNIVCRSQIDPSAALIRPGLTGSAEDTAFAQSLLAQDVAQCVPGNFFGEGNLSQAAKDYIVQDTVSHRKYTQFDLSGYVSGDTSEFLNLPGGPIGFSVGAELRKETLAQSSEDIVKHGLTFYNAIGDISGIPSFKVKEAFGELRLPILKDLSFAHELTVSAAGRVADYSGSTGTVTAWNVSGEYAPIADIRFRANVAKSVRAPNLTELFFPLSQNFSFLADPCA